MYSAREVATFLGVPSTRLRSYVRTGCLSPERDAKGALRFSFRDMVVLRKAEGLVGKSVPQRAVTRALRSLRDAVGDLRPLSGFNLETDGPAVVVEEGQRRWRPDSRQMLLDFQGRTPRDEEVADANANEGRQTISDLERVRGNTPLPAALTGDEAPTANGYFERGCILEDEDPTEARAAYRKAIDIDPDHADAHVNLGRLLHESGHPEAAQVHYRVALSLRPEDPTASFNLGVALEDTAQRSEAIRAYQVSIACDPGNADAHYNLARLLEQSGKADLAIRHLLIYRQLTKRNK